MKPDVRAVKSGLTFTLLSNNQGLATKKFWLNSKGQLEKQSAAQIFDGHARQVTVANLDELASFYLSLKPNQAVTFGLPKKASADLVTVEKKKDFPNAIARCREDFSFSKGPAIMFIDGDADTFPEPIKTSDAFRERLIAICPALKDANMVITSSASSYIRSSETGKFLRGSGGFHASIAVANGTDIPRAGKALGKLAWLHGYGSIKVSKSGASLVRGIIDVSVFDPERINFEAGAVCASPLEQLRPAPKVYGDPAGVFDSTLIADLSEAQQVRVMELIDAAKNEAAPKAKKIRDAYIGVRAKKVAKTKGIPEKQAREIIERGFETGTLPLDFVIQLRDGTEVTVREILADPDKYNGQACCDPLEPEYHDDPRIAIICMKAAEGPQIYSWAHGEHRFHLGDAPMAWKKLLRRTDRHAFVKDEENVRIVLENDSELAGLVRYDEFKAKVVLMRPIPGTVEKVNEHFPRQWQDSDGVSLQQYMQRTVKMPCLGRDKVESAVDQMARNKSAFHPVREKLASVKWDGVKRLDTWLVDYLGAHDADVEYLQAVGAAVLIGAVARIMRPGCKLDTAMVLEGPQGAMKSSASQVLALDPEWFSDSLPHDLDSKDARDHLRGKFVVELSELGALKRSVIETVKAYLSRQVERYRPPYGRHEVDFPRQCIFIGSTNADEYLVDKTGNRRFWPVKVGMIDLKRLQKDVGQLYAEALARYEKGEAWYLSGEIAGHAATEASKRVAIDPWTPAVFKACDPDGACNPEFDGTYSPGEVMQQMGFDEKEMSPNNAAKVGAIMRDLGMVPVKRHRKRGQLFVWPPKEIAPPSRVRKSDGRNRPSTGAA